MRWRTWLVVGLVVIGGIAAAYYIQDQLTPRTDIVPRSVSSGDREIVWLNTSTSFTGWEHLVLGCHQAAKVIPGLEVDDSGAFLAQSTAIPEVVLSMRDQSGKLRIRWYKLTSEANMRRWIEALAQRDPAPLAIIGGGSSDRARDLASLLEARTDWRGKRPLLLITTATANDISFGDDLYAPSRSLMQFYPGRTFRFCFTNRQMARAVVNFVWQHPNLRPSGGPPGPNGEVPLPTVIPVQWQDDPYSQDLSEEFRQALVNAGAIGTFTSAPEYSVGSFDRVNRVEEECIRTISRELPLGPGQRSLLILPTGPTPARRFIRALAGEAPLLGRHIVALTGDSIGIDHVYRDGAILWNLRDAPVPLVFFAHQNPVGWSDDLPPPNGTDEVLLFADLIRVLSASVFRGDGGLTSDADELASAIRNQPYVIFDADGNRGDGEEYVVCVRPEITETGRISTYSALEVWRRLPREGWVKIHELRAPYSNRPRRRLRPGRHWG